MNTADFDYALPNELIAQTPVPTRHASRMLVIHRSEDRIEHAMFSDLSHYLVKEDLVVLNDTRVIPARMFGTKIPGGGRVELLFLEESAPSEWEVLIRSSRRPVPGAVIRLGSGQATAQILARGVHGGCKVRIASPLPIMELLDAEGEPPLPPYIRRSTAADLRGTDRERYQTVYASVPGAVAAPTAGLHFTETMFASLDDRGVLYAMLTLHVGIGTFRPVRTERVEDHHLCSERFYLPESTARRISDTRRVGGRVIAIGSTSVRTLETQAKDDGTVLAGANRTRLFIFPPYRFKAVDIMLTNFHLPRSTLLMMACAFGGNDLILRAYREAVDHRYRFYSFGDCMLIL